MQILLSPTVSLSPYVCMYVCERKVTLQTQVEILDRSLSWIHTDTYKDIRMYMHVYVRTCVCTCVHTYMRTYVNVYIHTCVCTCVHMRMYMCMYICMHTPNLRLLTSLTHKMCTKVSFSLKKYVNDDSL